MSSVVIDVGARRSACSAVGRVARRESGRDLPRLVARLSAGHAAEASLRGEADGQVDDVVTGCNLGSEAGVRSSVVTVRYMTSCPSRI
jgi:hypothetical protein